MNFLCGEGEEQEKEKYALNLFAAYQVSAKLVAQTQGRMAHPRTPFLGFPRDSQSFLLEEIKI